MSNDIIDSLYDIRDEAHYEADRLRNVIARAQAKLEIQEKLWKDAEASAELLAVSDLFPTYRSSIPDGAGLVFSDGRNKYGNKDQTVHTIEKE